jgi:hypothetical protein
VGTEFAQGGIAMVPHVIGQIQRVHAINADEQHSLYMTSAAAALCRCGRRDDRQAYCQHRQHNPPPGYLGHSETSDLFYSNHRRRKVGERCFGAVFCIDGKCSFCYKMAAASREVRPQVTHGDRLDIRFEVLNNNLLGNSAGLLLKLGHFASGAQR